MVSSHHFFLLALAALISPGASDPDSICYSSGIDFVDDQQYFINSLSDESFTCVSNFWGCNQGVSDVLLVDPSGDEYLCSQVQTLPDNDPKLSTCPILKSQMVSGDWMILLVGNNGDGNPFAWERDLTLDVGPQATTTYTPTATFYITTTPTITAITTIIQTIVSTVGPFATTTIPSATAKNTKTVIPKPVSTTSTQTLTRSRVTWTKDLHISTKTVTATCTIPQPGKQDKPCKYSPTLLHPAAMTTPTSNPKYYRYMRKGHREVEYEHARSRIEAAKLKRDGAAKAAAIEERAPDAPTLTITAATPINTTVTQTASTITTTESVLQVTTSTSTLPPVTIYSGVFTSTVTLPTPTVTRLSFTYTTVSTTVTMHATWTRTITTTPSASVTACKWRGGHIGSGRH